MDNKKWSKRFSTVFWWSLTIAPLLIIVMYYLTIVLSFNRLGGNISDYSIQTIYESFKAYNFNDLNFGAFDTITIPFLQTAFEGLFNDVLNLNQYQLISIIFGYMGSIQVYHIMFDFVAWLPRAIHELMERKLC